MRNPGMLYELPDGRRAIVYTRKEMQPLAEKHNKFVLYLVDSNNNKIAVTGSTRWCTLIRTDIQIREYKLIGFID